MMRIDLISCVPELLYSPLDHSIVKRARDKGLVEIHVHNLRDFSENRYGSVDDYPYGGGAGMVMQIEPIAKCIRGLQAERRYDEVIFLTPDGEPMKQGMVNELSLKKNLIMLAGHYKGVDQRVRDLFITKEVSLGDFVLSGGELPALALTDAIVRLIPGVLGDESSALTDSFMSNLLEAPIYSRPADFEGYTVPEVLLGGNHKLIDAWRDEQAYEKTKRLRPDLLEQESDSEGNEVEK